MTKKSKQNNKASQVLHNQEFRETAIKLALAGDRPISEVASELEIPAKRLYAWVTAWKNKNSKPVGNGKVSADDELRRVLKRNKELELEVEILKKASAYFARTLL